MRKSVMYSGLVALSALLTPLPTTNCIELTFNPMVSTNFDDMTDGQSIDTLIPPWTGLGVSSLMAALPAGTGNSSALAINALGGTRVGGLSPEQTLPPTFSNASSGDTLYFSAWLLHNGGGGSVVFNSNSLASGYNFTLCGFGITEGATRHITFLADADGDGLPELTNSITTVDRNTWYEMALVIRLDGTNSGNSLGYLYYRKATDTEFTLLPEFQEGMKMSWWTPSFNATDFAYYRIDSARNNFQIDNLSVGMVIQESGLSPRTEATSPGLR